MKLTVHRPTWSRGRSSTLLSAIGSRCCLGFLAKALGATDTEIVGYDTITSCSALQKSPVRDRLAAASGTEAMLVHVNDSCEIDDALREEELTKLFAHVGIEVTFTDELEKEEDDI